MNGSPLYSIILLIVTFVVVALLEVFGKRRHIKTTSVVGITLALLALFLPLAAPQIGLIKADAFTFIFSIIFLLVSGLVIFSSHEATAVYNGSIILSTIGMILAGATNDIILLYVSIELVTSPTYVLVAYTKTAQRMEAGVKYFVVGIVASAFMLLGLALICSTAGTTTISEMAFSRNPLFLLGVGAFLAGISFKLGVFPFNFWIPDVYQGAPSEITGLLAGASKKAAYAALLRMAVVISVLQHWSLMFAILAGVTMSMASVAALLQTNARRLLAYSIMSQAGFLLLGIAVATPQGYAATILHSFTHAIMALGAFLVLDVFWHHAETLDELKGLGWRNPFLGASLTIFLLSLAGIPLLAGFVSKFYLVYATIEAGWLWLAILAILNSVIALYFYFKIIRALYAYSDSRRPANMRTGTMIAIAICVLLTIVIGVYPQPFIDLSVKAAGALMGV
jgi:F420H2 dehydrogenase subunit N